VLPKQWMSPPPTREILMTSIPVQRSASTTTAPASLTQARPSGTCPACTSSRLTVLAMTLTDGTPVRFASCHDCEHRSWSHEGEELQFADVIARATKQKV
jgi:formate dehydrogenase maturation protein FdhE